MSHKSDWVSYFISVIYATILIGCLLGIRKNILKKRVLLQRNEYEKQKRVIRWRYRFYLTLFSASLIRIISLISAVVLSKTMVLSKATSKQEFIWSFAASIASMLFFTAFTFIIWFFAHLAFHQQLKYKRLITPFFTALNVALYISEFSIAISSFAASKWDLVYDYELPLFAICGWILALCFIYLSYKISTSIQRETQDTLEYIEHSRRLSITHSQQYQQRGGGGDNSPLIGSGHTSEHKGIPIHYGGDIESSLSKNRLSMPLQQQQQQQQIQENTGNQSSAQHIIPRLIKLSLLCALCWIVRGLYLMSVRIWPSTDKTPFNIPELAWEAIFYCLTEYPPSLGSLILMISKPKQYGKGAHLSMHNESEYPQAKQQEY